MSGYQPTIPMAALAEGDVVATRVNNREVLIALVEGQFYAFDAYCSHARQALVGGRLRGFEMSCPLHGARFDIRSGACLAAPATQPIARFPVLLESGKVWVDVGAG